MGQIVNRACLPLQRALPPDGTRYWRRPLRGVSGWPRPLAGLFFVRVRFPLDSRLIPARFTIWPRCAHPNVRRRGALAPYPELPPPGLCVEVPRNPLRFWRAQRRYSHGSRFPTCRPSRHQKVFVSGSKLFVGLKSELEV